MLKSKYSFKQYYATAAFLLALLFPVILLLSHPLKETYNTKPGIPMPQVYGGLLILAMVLFGFIFLLKKFPVVIITTDGLTLRFAWKKKVIDWNDIERIRPLTSEPMGFLFLSQTMEASTIETKTGEKIILFEGFYRNMQALRIVLARAMALKEQGKNMATNLDFSIPGKLPDIDLPGEESADIFSDSFSLSFNGIVFGAVAAAPFVLLFLPGKNTIPAAIAIAFFALLFYLGFGTQAYYFLLSDTHLIIKNHLFRWYRKVYALEEIKDAKFELVPKRSTTLRITTTDFTTSAYSAGSLRDKTWKELLKRFEQKGISTRNEAYV